jgi:hypothetical protein
MKKLLTPLILTVLCGLLSPGCRSTAGITAGLKIDLTGIDRTGDGAAQVSWRVVNPNVVPYLLARSTHRIYLDGVLVGTVTDEDAVAVPAQSRVERRHALVLAGPAAERALAAAATTGRAAYRVDSVILIRLYGDETDKSTLASAGTVTVTGQ